MDARTIETAAERATIRAPNTPRCEGVARKIVLSKLRRAAEAGGARA